MKQSERTSVRTNGVQKGTNGGDENRLFFFVFAPIAMLRPKNSEEFFGARIGANANGTANSLFAAGMKQDNNVRGLSVRSALFSWNFHAFP